MIDPSCIYIGQPVVLNGSDEIGHIIEGYAVRDRKRNPIGAMVTVEWLDSSTSRHDHRSLTALAQPPSHAH
jgi:hypothetical protein